MQQKKNNKGLFVYLILLGVLMIIATRVFSGPGDVRPIEYNKIIEYFENGQVEEYSLEFGTGKLNLKLKDQPKLVEYEVPYVLLFIEDTHDMVKEYNLEHPDAQIKQFYIPPEQTPWWVSLLPTLLLVGLMVVFWYVMMKQSRGGANPMAFAKAKAKMPDEKHRVTFADVAGEDEEKEELAEIVDFLKDPQKYNKLGARIPKGVLLMGPPGTGKTLLAKAVAGEARVPFFSISGSDFVEMFVGVGASRVRDLFESAKKAAPSIIFIDEIDAVGRRRGAGLGGGHDEREQTLNQLLVEMDGFEANSGVIVIAATNRKDILDPALLRPGRFDRHVTVNYPDVKGREEILKVHTRNKPIAPDVDLSVIAKTCGGFTGADLENLVNEAALSAARKEKRAITMDEIQEATLKVIIGPEKRSHIITEKERKITAYHETGHAIVTFNCPTQDKVHQVSIVPRGGAGGFTLSLPEKDAMYLTKNEMRENICTLLGGRVAEEIIFGDVTTGASNDIERATKIARAMVTRYGFSDRLGNMVYGKDDDEVFLGMDLQHDRGYSEEVACVIDEEVRKLIDEAYKRAKDILTENIELLHTVAKFLMEHEKVDGETFAKIMRREITPDELEDEAKRVEEEEKRKREEDKERIAAARSKREAEKAAEAAGHKGFHPMGGEMKAKPEAEESNINVSEAPVDVTTDAVPNEEPVSEETHEDENK